MISQRKVKIRSTLLDNYIDELETDLEKSRLKKLMKSLYTEAGDLEI